MPRRSRLILPGFPHHIVQRGHRRSDVFLSDHDRSSYLQTLCECRETFAIKVYGYCLMSNHVHLIMDPGGDPKAISQSMKTLAGRHARRMNARHEWKGSLWESRFHCSPIDTERYLLICGRYIDLNPVRASMVACPSEYPWSSFRARAGFAECDWLDDDPALVGLSSSPAKRQEIYRNFVASEAEASDLLLIRGALQRNQLTGDASFVDAIACKFGIAVSARGRGRPPQ